MIDDIIGKKFGKLTVISKAPSSIVKNKNTGRAMHRARYNCQCDCGATYEITGQSLRRKINPVKSCKACAYANRKQSTRRYSAIERAFNLRVKTRAKVESLELGIDANDFYELAKTNCYYCGGEPPVVNVYKNKFAKSEFLKINGIDRKNPNLGYIKDNIVSCCSSCNYMKNTMSIENFLNHLIKLYNNLKNKGTI